MVHRGDMDQKQIHRGGNTLCRRVSHQKMAHLKHIGEQMEHKGDIDQRTMHRRDIGQNLVHQRDIVRYLAHRRDIGQHLAPAKYIGQYVTHFINFWLTDGLQKKCRPADNPEKKYWTTAGLCGENVDQRRKHRSNIGRKMKHPRDNGHQPLHTRASGKRWLTEEISTKIGW